MGWLWLWFVAFVVAAPLPSGDPTPDDVDSIEDHQRISRIARRTLESGDREKARELFELSLERREVSDYLSIKGPLKEALIDEVMHEFELAKGKYQEAIKLDPLRAVQVLRIISKHPERDALVEEAYARVKAAVASIGSDEQVPIYVTSKGANRYLTAYTVEDALKEFAAGKQLRYCYIENLDLLGRTDVPDTLDFNRCVIGSIRAPMQAFEKVVIKGFVLGDADFGKTWKGEAHKSYSYPPSTIKDLVVRDTIFVGSANFAGVEVAERAYFPMTVFEGHADFKAAEFWGATEFRFASFGEGANFKQLRMHEKVYFGGTRYRADTVFTGVFSERDVYFNSVSFDGKVSFDGCEFQRDATFENSKFSKDANFGTSKIAGNLNLSRASFRGELNIKEVVMGELDALGTEFRGNAWFMDAHVEGRARFSLDEVTRHAVQEDMDGLLHIYRRYQGDDDRDEPITTQSSYGVQGLTDLNSRIMKNISFANTVFGGFTVFEGVTFGLEGQPTVASFFNAQFRGETHFERTTWHSQADFTTIYGNEVAFNQALFHNGLILDDANIPGRVSLSGAEFSEDSSFSFFAAEIRNFEVDPDQLAHDERDHRLFYEWCAQGHVLFDDIRMTRLGAAEMDPTELRELCHDFAIDEFVALKDSYGDRAMVAAEDDAYWYTRHYQAMKDLRFGSWFTSAKVLLVNLLLFELCFGWGVRLGNLGVTAIAVTVLFAVIYRVFCPDTVLAYDGEDIAIRDVSFQGLCYISLQSLIAINTGWDFGADDHRFRWLNTIETVIGFVILTFFVGAYTRQILA